MKIYTADWAKFSGRVLVVSDEGGYFLRANGNAPPDPPTEFDWGYPGPAPLFLSFVLLADLTGDSAIAERWHRRFAGDVLRFMHRNSWSLSDSLVAAWLSRVTNDPNCLK